MGIEPRPLLFQVKHSPFYTKWAFACKTKTLGYEPGPLWFQVQHSPFYIKWAFACKTKTLVSLYSHVLLILIFKSQNQVMREQKFKDLLSSTWQVSVERRVLDLESEEQVVQLVRKFVLSSERVIGWWSPILKPGGGAYKLLCHLLLLNNIFFIF